MFVFPKIAGSSASAAMISDLSGPEDSHEDPKELEFIPDFPPSPFWWGNKAFEHDMVIDFSYSNMTSEDFHPNFFGPSRSHYNSINSSSDLKGTIRSMGLSRDFNRFEFLSESIFLDFFLAQKNNSISLLGNPIFCDERTAWLKKRGVQETQLYPKYCRNLPYVGRYHPTLYTFAFESSDWKGHEHYDNPL